MTDYSKRFKLSETIWDGAAILEFGGTRQPVTITNMETHYTGLASQETTFICESVNGGTLMSALRSPIRKVIYNNPATIVYWADGTKNCCKMQ